MRKKVGIFGGTFDPVHIGHLRLALELKQQLGLDEMRLVPCHRPPHRDAPQVSSAQRVEMLRLALQSCPELQLDERELQRDKPSYTYDTLCELRAEVGDEVSLVLCMGEDAFAGLATWHRWQELLELAHIAVIARPVSAALETGRTLPAGVLELLRRCEREVESLDGDIAGTIVLQSPRLLAISSSEIREQIKAGKSAQFLVADAVWDYIVRQNLYR